MPHQIVPQPTNITQSKLPLVSIITVVYNAEQYLERTILSVIGQKYPAVEYIIIDGGSKDGTMNIVKKYEANITKWISEKDKGIYDAMNKGLAIASGEWVNFLNGGDAFYDEHTLHNLFGKEDTSRYNFIYGDSINIKENFTNYIKPKKLSKRSLKWSLGLCHQSVFVRKTVSPMYDTAYRYKAEYNWVIDIVDGIQEDTIKYFPVPVVYYSLGGFSEKGMLPNLSEFIQITRKRFGLGQVILNSLTYVKTYLRHIKYSYFQ
jgi:glycosyltransferase involved in cell wall biosynthesis